MHALVDEKQCKPYINGECSGCSYYFLLFAFIVLFNYISVRGKLNIGLPFILVSLYF